MHPEHRRVALVGLGVIVLVGTVLLAELASSAMTGNPLGWYTRDPADTFDFDPIAGIESNLGVLALWATAAVLLFTWLVSRGRIDRQARGFLLWSGLFSGVLALDDLLRFHDDLLPRLTGRGERVVFALYAGFLLVWLIRYRRLILRTDQSLLLAALAILAGAVGVDIAETRIEDLLGHHPRTFLEDGLKFLGFVTWSAALMLHAVRVTEAWRTTPIPAPVDGPAA